MSKSVLPKTDFDNHLTNENAVYDGYANVT